MHQRTIVSGFMPRTLELALNLTAQWKIFCAHGTFNASEVLNSITLEKPILK